MFISAKPERQNLQNSHNGRDADGFVRRPLWWLHEVLSGRVTMQDAPESIQSWARLAIYQGAKEIVQMDWINDRRAAIAKIPPSVRPYVEAEIKRIWGMRECL